uniref:Uncharacterized protein n=1 Tax=Manihot esculenta TaxID=3983 RepID=A0A2C9W7I1_MANES
MLSIKHIMELSKKKLLVTNLFWGAILLQGLRSLVLFHTHQSQICIWHCSLEAETEKKEEENRKKGKEKKKIEKKEIEKKEEENRKKGEREEKTEKEEEE